MAENLNTEFEEEDDDIVELINENGDHEFFLEVARLPYKDEWYVCLKPCTESGETDDEEDVFFLKVVEEESGEDMLEVVTDEDILSDLYDEIMNGEEE